MPIEIDEILNTFKPILKSAQFRTPRYKHWHFKTDEILQDLFLEKSTWANKSWFRCYLSIRRMDGDSKPRFGINLSINNLIPNATLLRSALDQDNLSISWDERKSVIQTILKDEILPLLSRLRTEADVIDFYKKKKDRNEIFMDGMTAKFLGIWELFEAENREIISKQGGHAGQYFGPTVQPKPSDSADQ